MQPLGKNLFIPLNQEPNLNFGGMSQSTPNRIQKKPLFIPLEPKPPTPFEIVSKPIKQFISGGIPAVWKNETPPSTYKESLQRGYQGRMQDLSFRDETGNLNKQKIADVAMNFAPIGFAKIIKPSIADDIVKQIKPKTFEGLPNISTKPAERAKMPVEAFAGLPLLSIPFLKKEDEQNKKSRIKKKSLFEKIIDTVYPPSVINYKRDKILDTPKKETPKIVKTLKGLNGDIHQLDSGVSVRDTPKEYRNNITENYKNNPSIPKGILESILMQESSMGNNKTQYNKKIGEYAWLVGFTDIATKDLLRKGIVPDLNTVKGAIKALADYLSIRQNEFDEKGNITKKYKDAFDLYINRYAPQLTKDKYEKVKKIFDYYTM